MPFSDDKATPDGPGHRSATPHTDEDCACAKSGRSNYANADVAAAYKKYNDENQKNNLLRKRHASAHNHMGRLCNLKYAKVVDLVAYRAILKYFGSCR